MTEKKTSPFDFVNSIANSKVDLIGSDPEKEKEYVPFLVNRALSFRPETLMYAAEMNMAPHIDKKLQYDFLLRTVRKHRGRGGKWPKMKNEDDVSMLQRAFGFSRPKAIEALRALTTEQLAEISAKLDPGGRS